MIVATVDAVGIGIALWLIGVPLVIPLAILVFFSAFVPVVGAIVAGVVCALVALVSGGPTEAMLVIGATLLVQQLEGNVLYPIVMRRAVDVHPVAILIGVAVGGIIAGVLGAIVAVPVVAILGRVIAKAHEEAEAMPEGEGPVVLEPDGTHRFATAQDPGPPVLSSRSTSD
jgi:predicted PurR-regulated permease PerM